MASNAEAGRPSDRPQEYLRAVARQGRLEFLLHEYVEPAGPGTIPTRATISSAKQES